MKLQEKINNYLNEDVFDAVVTVEYKGKKYNLNFPVAAKEDDEVADKAKNFVELHKKNKHFPPETRILQVKYKASGSKDWKIVG